MQKLFATIAALAGTAAIATALTAPSPVNAQARYAQATSPSNKPPSTQPPSTQSPGAAPAVDCVPGGSSTSPSQRGNQATGETMSDKLAQSKGVICPPGGMDSDIRVTPPDGGRMRVIPPPATEPQAPK